MEIIHTHANPEINLRYNKSGKQVIHLVICDLEQDEFACSKGVQHLKSDSCNHSTKEANRPLIQHVYGQTC